MKKTIKLFGITAGVAFAFFCIIILTIYIMLRYSFVNFPLDSIRIISVEKTRNEIKVVFTNSESGFYPNKLKLRQDDNILYVWIGKGTAGISKDYEDITEVLENSSFGDCHYEFTLKLSEAIEQVVLRGHNKQESIILWKTENSIL